MSNQQVNSNDKLMGVLAYLGLLFLIPLFAAKDSAFARYHTNQGIVLCIMAIGCYIALAILGAILAFIPFVGPLIISLLYLALGILVLVFMILGIVHAANSECKPLPIIGGIVILK